MSYIQTLFLSSFCAFILSMLELAYFYIKTTSDVKNSLDSKSRYISDKLSYTINNLSDPKLKYPVHSHLIKLRDLLNSVKEKKEDIDKTNTNSLMNGITISIKILIIAIVSFIFIENKSFIFSFETFGSVLGVIITFIIFQLYFFKHISSKYASISNNEIIYSVLLYLEPFVQYIDESKNKEFCKK